MDAETKAKLEVVKYRGWKNVISRTMERGGSISSYAPVALRWDCCALGEVCGFPDSQYDVWKAAEGISPALGDLGCGFCRALEEDRPERALYILEEIQSHAPEFVKKYKEIRGE